MNEIDLFRMLLLGLIPSCAMIDPNPELGTLVFAVLWFLVVGLFMSHVDRLRGK